MVSHCRIARVHAVRRLLHATSSCGAITRFQMPAMSPTMTEGGIAEWKKKEGETFTAGEVLVEIETDKATIDVEAQEDGVMGRIIAQNGGKNIPVGSVIALLAQEGDDISNLELPPKETVPSSAPPLPPSPPRESQISPPSVPTTQPSNDRPFFPSVLRLLEQNNVSDEDTRRIKATGIRGMLTKGDVLAHLGKASGPNGTFKDNTPTPSVYKSQAVLKGPSTLEKKALDPHGIRQAVLTAFLERSAKARTSPSPSPPNFESIIADYLPLKSVRLGAVQLAPPSPPKSDIRGYLDGLY